MTLKIVSNDSMKEVHSVRLDDGVITIIAIEDGSDVTIKEMEKQQLQNVSSAIKD